MQFRDSKHISGGMRENTGFDEHQRMARERNDRRNSKPNRQ